MTSTHRFALTGTALLAALLAACGGGSDPAGKLLALDGYSCTSFEGAQVTAVVDPTCVGCSVGDAAKAADGDLDSAAAMSLPPPGVNGGASVLATAPEGAQFEPGGMAGAVVSWTMLASIQDGATIRTYLDGALQEEGLADGFAFRRDSSYPQTLLAIPTFKPFDAVEFEFSRAAGGPFDGKVHELCSNATLQ